jgi:Spx/MgsR family transcriptional regulator
MRVPFEERDTAKKPLTRPEIEALVGSREVTPFLSTRNELYRERGMKANPPSREQAIALMAEHPNLMRRPLLVAGEEIVFGFDEEAYRRLIAGGS